MLSVYGADNNASVVGYTVNGEANATTVQVNRGQIVPVSITFRNTENRPWTSGSRLHKLVCKLFGWGADTTGLPVATVFQNQNVTFTFNVTVPSVAGTYAQEWQMAEYVNSVPKKFGSSVSVSFVVNQPPSVPAGLSASSSAVDSITLNWQPIGANLVRLPISYEIYDAAQNCLLATTAASAWTHSGLIANSLHFYKIRARDGAGNVSAFSDLVMGVPARATLGADSDNDGMPDAWELANGLNPHDASDASADADGDGISNLEEFKVGWNPRDLAAVVGGYSPDRTA